MNPSGNFKFVDWVNVPKHHPNKKEIDNPKSENANAVAIQAVFFDLFS